MRKQPKAAAKYVVNRVLPVGTKRRKVAKALLKKQPLPARDELSYKDWIKQKEPLTVAESETVTSGPLISLVVPCYNTPAKYINELVTSIMAQSYSDWQLCLADGSTNSAASSAIKGASLMDKRITYIKLKDNLGIAANTNKAIEKATGKYVAFMDHDDLLPKWALAEVALAIKRNPKAEVFYSDEDRLSDDGKTRLFPLFKPGWSPDLFLCVNYPAHFLVAKKSLVDKLGGLRPDYDGSQDYDFLLRALDRKPQIVHIPKILYHMRMAASSTASAIGVKGYADEAGNKAVVDYFKRNKIKAEVLGIPGHPTNYRIKYELNKEPLATIIIPFKDKIELLVACLKSIKAETAYKNYEIVLITNNSVEKRTFEYLDTLKKEKNIRVYHYNKPFNYSALNNFGRRKAKGDVLVFLNNDTEVLNPEWLTELVSVAVQKNRGAVGALMFYPDDTIQHAGIILGMVGAAGHIFKKLKLGHITSFWLPDWPRNYLAVTGACLAVETKKFDKVHGFDESIVMAGSDVVLCLQLYKQGLLNVYWPYARIRHHESKSVGSSGSYQTAPPTDYDRAMAYYKPYLNYKDPYFNPNLSLGSEHDRTSEQIKLRSEYESKP